MPEPQVDLIINIKKVTKSARPVMQSLGCNVSEVAPPHPSTDDTINSVAGAMKRVARKLPKVDAAHLKRFRQSVKESIREIPKLSPSSNTTHEFWFQHVRYPFWRMQQLREAYDSFDGLINPSLHYLTSGFIKAETYMKYKYARTINSRCDFFKAWCGAIFHLIEKAVVAHYPQLIKQIPVKDRPAYIMEHVYMEGATYIATDYVAYEASFTREIMEACEMQLYEHMTSLLPQGREFMEHVRGALTGKNHMVFKDFILILKARRMSGEMCTSLGNGFTNLQLMKFACREAKSEGFGVVEGDDGLFRIVGPIPDVASFTSLGFDIKLEVHQDLSRASFCGIIFDPTDGVNITDPVEVLLNFGWSKQDYCGARRSRCLELLRSKSLSFAHQYAGCPIIQELAFYGLRMTKHIDMRRFIEKERGLNMWDREQLEIALSDKIQRSVVPENTRHLMEDVFGISIDDQIKIERYLAEKKDLSSLNHPSIDNYMPEFARDYFVKYVRSSLADLPMVDRVPYDYGLKAVRNKFKFISKERITHQIELFGEL